MWDKSIFIKNIDKIINDRCGGIQKRFNEAIGDRQAVTKWKSTTKDSRPSVDMLLRISRKFNVSLDWLLTGKETDQFSCPVKCDAELIEMCNDLKEILKSDDKETIEAIKSNIIAFKKSVRKDQTINNLDKRISHLENILFRDRRTDFAGGG